MAPSSIVFIVFNRKLNSKQKLSLPELRQLIFSLGDFGAENLFVWTEGWSEWKPLIEGAKFVEQQIERGNEMDIDTVIELKVHKPSGPTQVQSKGISGNNERRKSRRYPLRGRVMMVWGQSVYRTFTIDVSLDGLRLEHPVPEELAGQVVDCYLSSPDLKMGLRFRGVLVGSASESKIRLRFVEQQANSKAQLREWLNQLKRKAA